MAHSYLRLSRPCISSARFLLTSACKRKDSATQIALPKDREKQDLRSTSAAGEDYFSGLINNLQANNFENATKAVTSDKKDDLSIAEDRTTSSVLRPSAQNLISEPGLHDAKISARVELKTGESKQVASVHTHSSNKHAKIVFPVNSNSEKLRMTLAGCAEEEPPARTTLATLPPPVLPLSEILCSGQVAADVEVRGTNVSENSSARAAVLADENTSTKTTLATLPSPVLPLSHILFPGQEAADARDDVPYADTHITIKAESNLASNIPSAVNSKNESEDAIFSHTKLDITENQNLPDDRRSFVPSTNDLSSAHDVVEDADCLTVDGQSQLYASSAALHSSRIQSIPIDDVAPAITPSFNFAAFVHRSESLQKLVKLGVDLSVWEAKKDVPEYVLRLDFEKDMKGHVQFLNDVGVPADCLGHVLTKNPFLFKQSLENLQIRLNYLQSKRFTKDAIGTIILKSPLFLNLSTKVVDERLGYLQKLFALTGDEVRNVITRLPKLVSWRFANIQQMQFSMLEEFGFSTTELKMIFMAKPKLWLASRPAIQERFDFLHTTVGISHKLLTKFPGALLCRKFITHQRHSYLKHLGRAQYDPTKPNYVSLKALVSGSDSDFCRNVAKTPVKQFNDFLKTL